MTYEQLQLIPIDEDLETSPLRSCRQVFPVSRTVLLEKVWAIAMSVTCGEKLRDVSENLDHAGLSVKIRPVYSQETISGIFGESYPTLPRWGIALGGEYGELATLEHRIRETECSLLQEPPTSMEFVEKFPTPTASDAQRVMFSEESLRKVGLRRTKGEYKKAGCNLAEYVTVFPTPPGQCAEQPGGKLNPAWVEWLMGYPEGYTEL